MQTNNLFRTLRFGRNLGNRQRTGVGSKNCRLTCVLFNVSNHFLLKIQVFKDRFYNHIGALKTAIVQRTA